MKKNNALNEALDSFKLAQTILKEDFGMAPEGRPMPHEEMPQEKPMSGPEQQDIAHYHGGNPEQAQMQQPQEEKTDMNLSKSDERIAHIREIALDGLQDYAQDVDSEAYQFYKKIWLMCDKAVSEKDSASNGGGAA